MYGTFVQSTYEDKEERDVYLLSKKFSHVTFGPREDRVQVSHVLDSGSGCTYIPDSKCQDLFHSDSKLGDSFFWKVDFVLSSPIGFTYKFVRSVQILTIQSDAAAESESNYKSKGVTSPPLGPIGLVRPRFSFRLPWDVLPPPWPPPLAPI